MLASINLICFVICLVCIVAGTTISILAIWGVVEKSYIVLKSLLTFGIIFLASLLTITVNKLIPVNRTKKEQEKR
jgi:arginine exporter protein ArgO